MTFDELFQAYNFKDSKERDTLKTMYEQYMSDIPGNFYRNQFELSTQYPGTQYEDWVKILRYPAFDTWKKEQISIIAKAETDKALVGGGMKSKEAVNLLNARKDVLESENIGVKPTTIVVPDSLFFK